MNKRIFILMAVVLLALLVGVLLTACGGQAQPAAPAPTQAQPSTALDGQALLKDRCARCHDVGRVERARKTADEWKATVERMVSKGAALNSQEQEALIKYLAQTYPK